jgi:hypothetical protein
MECKREREREKAHASDEKEMQRAACACSAALLGALSALPGERNKGEISTASE